jgi:hypothetical protein
MGNDTCRAQFHRCRFSGAYEDPPMNIDGKPVN